MIRSTIGFLVASLSLSLAACSGAEPDGTGGVGSSATSGASTSAGTGGGCAAGMITCGDGCAELGGMFEASGHLWRDCDGDGANGCEVNTFGDVNNCGGCGVVCNIGHAAQTCVEPGYCEFVACLDGYFDCDTMIVNGCEAHPVDDVNNCGVCGLICKTSQNQQAHCVEGTCQIPTCNEGFSDCNQDQTDGCEIQGACK